MIEGRKVYVVPFELRHLEDPRYEGWLRDPLVMRLIGRDEYLQPFEFSMVVQYVRSLWENPFCYFWAVHAHEDGQFIGTFKLKFESHSAGATRSADVGVMIGDRTRWNRGCATDTLQAGCHHAFENLDARKLTAGANAANLGVISAFLKLGFREEGRLRQKILTEGTYYDHVLMGCFPEELVRPM